MTNFLGYTGYLTSPYYKTKYSEFAIFCSCSATELSILLTSCLTAIKNHIIKMFKVTKSVTMNIFRKKYFLFKSFVKVELSYVVTTIL